MPLSEGHKANFETLQRAFDAGDVCLMECIDKKTEELIPVICAVQYSGDEETPIGLVPFAKLFTGNPYEEVDPPTDEVQVCENTSDNSSPPAESHQA